MNALSQLMADKWPFARLPRWPVLSRRRWKAASDDVLTAALTASREAERLRPSGEAASITRSFAEIYSDLVSRQHLVVDESVVYWRRHCRSARP
jgi:hypothetical protein